MTLDDRIKEATKWADKVSESVTYPVNNAKELLQALGGEGVDVEYGGRKMNLGQLKKTLPEAFFPVESREDLIARIGYLETRTTGEDEPAKGEERKAPPADAGDPPDVKKEPRKGAFPGIRGHGKRDKRDKPGRRG